MTVIKIVGLMVLGWGIGIGIAALIAMSKKPKSEMDVIVSRLLSLIEGKAGAFQSTPLEQASRQLAAAGPVAVLCTSASNLPSRNCQPEFHNTGSRETSLGDLVGFNLCSARRRSRDG